MNMSMDTNPLSTARRIVVKIGSALLVDQTSGEVHHGWLQGLAADVAAFRARGAEIIVVTSGAIAAGRRHLRLSNAVLRLEESQAAAACGQIRLAHAYQAALAEHDVTVAQVLLTIGDMDNRRRYLNARNTISALLGLDAVPVINENDTVATAEIRFGDNDRLAAGVAAMMGADALVLLSSDIDGLYTSDPGSDDAAEWVPTVAHITPEIEAMAGAAGSSDSSGGMVTKLMAARAATASGCNMAIANGQGEQPLQGLLEGARATWFLAGASPNKARKQWIASALQPHGTLVVDAGAARALGSGKSLLPAGVTSVDGRFERGDAVAVRDAGGQELGRGLVAYSADDAARIIGHKTGEIEQILGYRGRDEMIHRDDLVLSGESSA